MALYNLNIPVTDDEVRTLRIGDMVSFSGSAWTCRSRLHRYIFDEGHRLPFSTENQNVLIHVGPIIVRENNAWRLVSFTPTSSIRFEKWGARSVEEWKLKAIVGKTTMGPATMAAMKRFGCVHLAPVGVTPELFVDRITVKDVYLFDELGSIEASWQLHLEKIGPFIVDIDTEGNNYFEQLDRVIDDNRKDAYKKLGIPEDFEYTKLY